MKLLLIILCVLFSPTVFAQLYMTRSGYIGFFSKTPLENIKAVNNQVYAVIDPAKKNLAFTLLVKGFRFEKELMQEHFNENYAESDKYPKASFTGAYADNVLMDKDGIYNITVKGNLTFHGITNAVEFPATLEVKQGKLLGQSHFTLKPEDYNIRIPSLVREKIDKLMTVDVQVECLPQ
ncbi:MAG: YceI family protein [Ilyomonas sp.]